MTRTKKVLIGVGVFFGLAMLMPKPEPRVSTAAEQATEEPKKVSTDDDGITSPTDTPQQRRNQIAFCQALLKAGRMKPGDEMLENCQKLLVKSTKPIMTVVMAAALMKGSQSQQDKEKQICAAFQKKGGFCYGGEIYLVAAK